MNDTLSPVAERLRSVSPEFHEHVRANFFDKCPETMLVFPLHKENVHADLGRVLSFVFDRTPVDGHLTDEMRTLITQLGKDHRKYNVSPRYFHPFVECLRDSLLTLCSDLQFKYLNGADTALGEVSTLLARSIARDDAAGIPRNYTATVVDVQRRCRRISVVRLKTRTPIDFQPGSYFPISSEVTPGIWRFYTSALPPTETGEMEFHVRTNEGGLSSVPLANSRIGDKWLLGNPYGRASIDGDRDVLMIANSVGLAPLRSLILSQVGQLNPARVHLFFGAEYPGELYDLRTLWEVAATAPWLTVTPVVEHDTDKWWVRATEWSQCPRGLNLTEHGTLEEVLPRYGTWADRQILIGGPPAWIPDMRDALVEAGTPPENILYNAL